ncbi:cation:proton antiporter [Endothiovibrio diazotrophicus]
MHDPALLLAAIALSGILCQWLAWRVKLPAILPLLAAGILFGPVGGLLDPDALLGELLFPLVSLGVAVVLFEGSLSLKLHQLAGGERVVRNLISVGALLNGGVIALAAYGLAGLPPAIALLFGAIMTVTGPTVVTPLLRTVRPTARVAHILRWEGILIDPLGAMLAVMVFEAIVVGERGGAFTGFLTTLAVGTGLGAAGAWGLAALLKRHLLPEYLVNVATLSLVLGLFAASNLLAHEAGLLTVTVMGALLANRDDLTLDEVVSFKESLSVLLVSSLFILLAARLDPAAFADLGWETAALLLVIVAVARPLAVAVSTRGSSLERREQALIAFIAPRGIVAAAVSALFALRLQELGVAGAERLVPLVFLVIIFTVVLQSLAARPLARLLGVAEPEPHGVLIVGTNRFARAVAKALHDNDVQVLLAGPRWEELAEARMAGIDTYFGNPVSEHADRNLELVGLGRLLALSRRADLNALSCLRYRNEFGANRVYSLPHRDEQGNREKQAAARSFAAPRLFGEEAMLATLTATLRAGGEIRTTRLSEQFDFAAYTRRYRHRALPLFAIDPQGLLHVYRADGGPQPQPGWRLLALLPAELLAPPAERPTTDETET